MRKVLMILALLAVAAFASDPRLFSLGGDVRLLVNDYLEMWAYPGTIGDYEMVTGGSETSESNSDGWFGMVKDFSGTTYGVAINHNDFSHEILFSPGAWGLILSVDFEKSAPADTVTQKDMNIALSWGTEVSFLADYSDLVASIGFDRMNIDSDTLNRSVSDLTFETSIRGHRNGFFNLFPIITAGMNKHDVDTFADSAFTVTEIAFDFGAGHNQKITNKTTLITGVFVGLQSTSYSGDYPDEEGEPDSEMLIDIPKISLGIEQEISKWLVFRAGAECNTLYYSRDDYSSISNSFDTNFGLGMHWNNFKMDATISEGFLHDGPYLVGGEANGFMGSLAATYTF